jgi:GxxExxY protein
MEKELTRQGIPFQAEKKLSILYKGEALNPVYKPDLICYDGILVELRSLKSLRPGHYTLKSLIT